jgi:hypothetical protein
MAIPSNIDSEAIRLLEEADWPWSDTHMAFIEARDPERETTEDYHSRSPDRISYAELRDQGLAGSAPTPEREAGLRWLRGRLSASS